VTATPSSTGRPDENVIVAVAFDDGSIASITYTNRGSDRRPIYYQAYHAMKGDVTGLIEDFARLTVHRKGKEVATWAGAIDLGHRRQMRLVADALVDDAEPPVPLAAAMASASTVLAAAESARIGEAIHLEIAKLADNRRRDANLRV
jgi:predicted dehydrogenase